MNRKVKSFKQCFYLNNKMFAVLKVTTHVRMLSVSIETGLQSNFATRLFPAEDTLFEVSSEIRCSTVRSV